MNNFKYELSLKVKIQDKTYKNQRYICTYINIPIGGEI